MDLVPGDVNIVRVANRDPWQALQARRSRRAQENATDGAATVDPIVASADQSRLRAFLRDAVHKIESSLYHPDMAMPWIPAAIRAVTQAASDIKADVIWATAPPWSSFIVAALSARRLRMPYVLDFRDSWTMTYTNFERPRPLWAKRLDRRILRKLLDRAAGVILRSQTEAECFYRAYYGALQTSKIHIIPNGFDGRLCDHYDCNLWANRRRNW
jgi:hypothetical protein